VFNLARIVPLCSFDRAPLILFEKILYPWILLLLAAIEK